MDDRRGHLPVFRFGHIFGAQTGKYWISSAQDNTKKAEARMASSSGIWPGSDRASTTLRSRHRNCRPAGGGAQPPSLPGVPEWTTASNRIVIDRSMPDGAFFFLFFSASWDGCDAGGGCARSRLEKARGLTLPPTAGARPKQACSQPDFVSFDPAGHRREVF